MKNWQPLHEAHRRAIGLLAPVRGGARRNRPHDIDRDATRAYTATEDANPVMKMFPQHERARMQREQHEKVVADRRMALGVALHGVHHEAHRIIAEGLSVVQAASRDVSLTLPDVLNHVDANGMLSFELLRLHLEQRMVSVGPDELPGIYRAALGRRDARALIELELIEAMVTGPLASSVADIAALRDLREVVAFIQEERVREAPDFAALAEELDRLEGRAQALQVLPIDPDHNPAARAAYEAELDAMTAAGAASDADEHARLREEARA